MIYAERAYFDGDHCQHVAAREEHYRLLRIRLNAIRLITERRKGGRFSFIFKKAV